MFSNQIEDSENIECNEME